MVKARIQVIILDNSKGQKCMADCGIDWSASEVLALARQRLQDRFGDRVDLDYLDLAKPAANRHPLELSPEIRNMPSPVLLINGKAVIAGLFDIRQLLDTTQAEIELEEQP